jgi:cytochrome P450
MARDRCLHRPTRVDLLDPELYRRDPHDVWAWMRANEPVYRDERNGLWGITRHADVMHVERTSSVFCRGRATGRCGRPRRST